MTGLQTHQAQHRGADVMRVGVMIPREETAGGLTSTDIMRLSDQALLPGSASGGGLKLAAQVACGLGSIMGS